jgi:hypothetical protein
MARQGLNCVLSYLRNGTKRQYRIRVGTLSHGVVMVYTEDAARTNRAFYPHRTAMDQFSIIVLLKNWDERYDFTKWLANYAQYAINPDIATDTYPWMTVSIPSREFSQPGMPLQGYEWGAHTGQMMFQPQIVFEATTSPGQKGRPDTSSVINKWSAFSQDPAIKYFYPFGTQLSGLQGPVTQTGVISYPGAPSTFVTRGGPTPPAGGSGLPGG